MIGDHDLRRRALAAYFRGGDTEQPEGTPAIVEHDGKRYVVLSNVNGTLAVFRFRANYGDAGLIKRLKRWPAEVAK